ncbi:hypothetical protein B0H13DRAFT_1873766 [Mycena leptocephala]|nr:hypothetical protein B0H13DRAFT_1895328 [Mycena leptocephala]KAJ7913651.1 hypothetical protein B0H13DRAFT_1873766 [Mycena leptocephala]
MTLLYRGDPGVKIWRWVKKLISLLGTLGMSSEDVQSHKVVINGKRLVDSVADRIALKKGTFVRPRLRTNAMSNTPAPIGLPATLYDEQWMADGLIFDPEFMEDLQVSEEAFELMELVASDLGAEEEEEEEEEEEMMD